LNSDVKFAGGGPMGKIEGRVGGMVGVEFAGSIAALYGQQKTSAGFHYGYSYWGVDFPLFGADGSDTDWKWLTDVEVSAGLSVKPSESVNLSAGYRYERIDKLDNTFDQSDISAHGPYLKVEMKF
jgi:opacity protein-like surface antigen